MKFRFQQLTSPWFHIFAGTNSDLTNLAWKIAQDDQADVVVRIVRGLKMQTQQALFDEVAAAFQFPDYFGENWNALDECLSDLSWIRAAGYVLLIRDSSYVLSQEKIQFSTFISVLANVAKQWSIPVMQGEAWDRPSKPFHIVLQGELKDVQTLQSLLEQLGESTDCIPRLCS